MKKSKNSSRTFNNKFIPQKEKDVGEAELGSQKQHL